MPFPRLFVALVVLASTTTTCAGPSPHHTEPPLAGVATASPAKLPVTPERIIPPLTPPPPLSEDTWLMPDIDLRRPPFPYFPDEDLGASRSIGDVADGYMINSARLPLPHPHLVVLPVQFQRRLIFTTDEMIELVSDAAQHVAKTYEGAVLHLGNFSAEGGGDIPYSVSHNSGRDADIAFFVVDADGNPTALPDLLPLQDNGEFIGEPDSDYQDHAYFFDTPRNWAFIEGLLLSKAATIQYVFVSNPLRNLLLDYARTTNVDPKLIARAQTILVQPGGALPHDDHFHIRTYCSELDMRSGCKDTGRRNSEFRSHTNARNQTIARARKLLKNKQPDLRTAAVQRLAIMQAHNAGNDIARLLDDPDPHVRAASARALADLGGRNSTSYVKLLSKQLQNEQHPHALAEQLSALGTLGGRTASNTLRQFLEHPRPVSMLDTLTFDARTIAAGALVAHEDVQPISALIAMLNDDNTDLRVQTARALQLLTNHQFGGDWHTDDLENRQNSIDAWKNWYEEHKKMSRDQWLTLGFQQAGLEVQRLSIQYVWEITRAISRADHLSYNAQRTLMRLAKREPNSLAWSKEDASFFWRRWFERRITQLGAPPIPLELSTLQDQ